MMKKNIHPYSLNTKEKLILFEKEMNKLTNFHYFKSKKYQKILKGFKYNLKNKKIENLPFLTTNIFKDIELMSIPKNKIFKILSSSGTSGSKRSKIFLDKDNSISQRTVLTKIFEYHFGSKRLPMIMATKNPKSIKSDFDAKYAAVLGFSIFGTDHTFLYNNNNQLDLNKFEKFINKYKEKEFILFGFTFDIFQIFFEKIKKKYDLSKCILIHGGGWKKLENRKISDVQFNKKFKIRFNLKKIYNYYGLIEQIGSIFFKCPDCNNFICSDFSDVLIRDKNFRVVKNGKGLVQIISRLPKSYPGHNILTEDIGEIIKNNNCKHSHLGKSFKVYGRVKNTEIRGCSDV
jgi:phenylacetate-coenzyme A ligase PaaK-like adenylate-forming protein